MESNHHLRIFSPPHRPALLPLHWWTSTTPSPVAASSVPNFRQREAFHSCCCQLLAHTISSVPSAAVKIRSPPEGRFIRYLQTLGPTWKVSVPPSGCLYRQAHWRNGGGAGIRTPVQTVSLTGSLIVCCRGGWTRTNNLRFWRPAFYQLNYTPVRCPVTYSTGARSHHPSPVYLYKYGLDTL